MKSLTMAIILAGCARATPESEWPEADVRETSRPVAGREAFESPAPGQGMRIGDFLLGKKADCESVVESRIVGSFTGPNRKQSLFVIHEIGCGPASEGRGPRTAVVFERSERIAAWPVAGPAVASVDADGDGTDEWVEASTACHLGSCIGSFAIRRAGSLVTEVQEAYLYSCGLGGDGTVSWKELHAEPGRLRVVRKISLCRPAGVKLLD